MLNPEGKKTWKARQSKQCQRRSETGPRSQTAPFKSVLECARNRAPAAPEGTPPKEKQTWPRPPSAPPTELDEESSQRCQIGDRVSEVNEEGRNISGWDQRAGTLLAWPKRCDQHHVICRGKRLTKEDLRSLWCSKGSEVWMWRRYGVSSRFCKIIRKETTGSCRKPTSTSARSKAFDDHGGASKN